MAGFTGMTVPYFRKKGFWIAATVVLLAAVAVYVLRTRVRPADSAAVRGPQLPPEIAGVACLGRIEPEDGVIRVGARSLSGQPSIVGELKVREGGRVNRGDLIAVLNSMSQLEAAWRYAEAQIKVAEGKLAQVRAGAKPSELEAQRAEIARTEAELALATEDLHRAEQLHQRDVAAKAVVDQYRAVAESKLQSLKQARERLNSLAEVRDVDVALASAEVQSARAEAIHARQQFEQTLIRSPVHGVVLRIHAWPQEEVASQGILELAKTDRMYVIAEVMESDIRKVRVGQRAVVTGEALPSAIGGTVEEIRPTVARSSMLDVDPAAFSDTRVIEVKVRLDENTVAQQLINAQVKVVINAGGSQAPFR